MSSWMNDAAVQNHNGAGFNHLNDPNAGAGMLNPSAFMTNLSSFDPSQFQNQQLQQMQNGGMRNPSPSFNQPVYQTNQVIPSKRPRPTESGMATSPRQTPGMIAQPRSETPQQNAYPGFQPNNLAQHTPQQTAYSHLQNGSANASPSPILGNQLRSTGVPQRVSTASPHPFSPVGQQFSGQGSPVHSEHGRVDGPQNMYMPNNAFAPGFNQNFTSSQGRSSAPPQNPMAASQMQQPHLQQHNMYGQQQPQPQTPQQPQQQTVEQQKMLYHMRLQQQIQQSNMLQAQARGQNMSPNVNPLVKPPMQGANGQFAGMRPQQMPMQRPANPESFMKQLVSFMQSKQLPLDLNPIVGDRQINLVMLYMAVQRLGGYRKVTQQNLWPQVSQALQFHPIQHQSAPQQLKGHYERNLLMFEEAWASQQRNRVAMMQQGMGTNVGMPGQQMSPTKQMNPQLQMQQNQQFLQAQQQRQQQQMAQQPLQQQAHLQQAAQSTPVKQMTPMHRPQSSLNGFSTPTPVPGQQHMASQGRGSISRSDSLAPNGTLTQTPTPASTRGASLPAAQADLAPEPPAPKEFALSPILKPKVRIPETYGGHDIGQLLRLGTAIGQFRPDHPSVADMGTIDIHALTMSLASGIHAEVRLALDSLALISVEPRLQLDLRACEDLVETLIDCAEAQVELLVEYAPEVSDDLTINTYEDVVRACRSEHDTLQDVPVFGSIEYELDRSIEKLICITTIMRNLSFYESNHALLTDETVINFLCSVIKHLGTRNMLLRTNLNTLDFMKDIIIFLSNLAQAIELPGREQGLCLLHFLLAFAPSPPPNVNGLEKVIFATYDPSFHRYLPPAVDSLAKLLARDEPNRKFYREIFSDDVTSSPPYDLLTRSFGLAISPIPDYRQDGKKSNLAMILEARKPYLMQGMLAADILSSLAPGFESGIAKSWLTSEDGFAQNLCRLTVQLCLDATPQVPHQRGQQPVAKGVEDEVLQQITLSGISVLRRLAEKVRDPDDPKSSIPLSSLPPKEGLLDALKIVQPRLQGVLKHLCVYAGLDK
ncbi:hypothetical protein F5884DRAFT_21755 [Xylogone sp. PMI_703]|nr:hypothetical protein F5884DRAFT_21755 [Xylogone sp. PMI_703]